MFDAFTKVVAQADARGEFLGDAQLAALSQLVADGNKPSTLSTGSPVTPPRSLPMPLVLCLLSSPS